MANILRVLSEFFCLRTSGYIALRPDSDDPVDDCDRDASRQHPSGNTLSTRPVDRDASTVAQTDVGWIEEPTPPPTFSPITIKKTQPKYWQGYLDVPSNDPSNPPLRVRINVLLNPPQDSSAWGKDLRGEFRRSTTPLFTHNTPCVDGVVSAARSTDQLTMLRNFQTFETLLEMMRSKDQILFAPISCSGPNLPERSLLWMKPRTAVAQMAAMMGPDNHTLALKVPVAECFIKTDGRSVPSPSDT